jgi:hypothetical protein
VVLDAKQARDFGGVAWMDLQEMAVAMRDDAGIVPLGHRATPQIRNEARRFLDPA